MTRRIKILHLIDSAGLYGAEKMLLTLASEQVKQGFQPTILSANEGSDDENPLETEAIKLGLPVKRWTMDAGLNVTATRHILDWSKRNHYDVMHTHGYKFDILVGMSSKRAREIPLVCTVHGYTIAPFFFQNVAL